MNQNSLKSDKEALERDKEALNIQISNLGRDKESGKEQLLEEVKRLRGDNDKLNQKILIVEDQNSDLREKIQSLEDEAEEKMQVNSQLQDKQKTISALNEKIRSLASQVEKLSQDKEQLKAELQSAYAESDAKDKVHQNELEVKTNVANNLQAQVNRLNEEIAGYEEAINSNASNKSEMNKLLEREYQQKVIALREDYESTIKQLKDKVLEYKERLKLEEQKQAQSNDFGFEDDELARVQLENESLLVRVKAAEQDSADRAAETEQLTSENKKLKRSLEQANGEVLDLKKQLSELRSLYQKLEMANEQMKKSGPNDKMVAASLKHYEELERKYIQTKK